MLLPSGRVNYSAKTDFMRPGFRSQANTGPAQLSPNPPWKNGSLKGNSSQPGGPGLGPHPREADFIQGTCPIGPLPDGLARTPPSVCSLVPLHGAPSSPARSPEQGWKWARKRLAPLLERPVLGAPTLPNSGLGLKQLLPALPFPFTLVFNPKVKLKPGTLWDNEW